MQDRTILITGCSSGIGLDAALTLKDRSYTVIPTARKIADVERLRELGFPRAFLLDIQNRDSIGEAMAHLAPDESLHALINNAWSGLPGAQQDLSQEALRDQFDYVFGSIQLTQQCLPLLQRHPGRSHLIQISSVLGFTVLPFRGAYAGAKAAWEAHTEALRMELSHLADNNLAVSVIQPGPIVTAFRRNSREVFNRLVTPGSQYAHCYKQLLGRLDSEKPSPGALPAAAVTRAILHALQARHPQPRYAVTTNTRLMQVVETVLPTSLKERIKRKMF